MNTRGQYQECYRQFRMRHPFLDSFPLSSLPVSDKALGAAFRTYITRNDRMPENAKLQAELLLYRKYRKFGKDWRSMIPYTLQMAA